MNFLNFVIKIWTNCGLYLLHFGQKLCFGCPVITRRGCSVVPAMYTGNYT